MDLLERIQRLVYEGEVEYTAKAAREMVLDGLDDADVEGSILRARTVRSKRLTSPDKASLDEMVHIIEGFSLSGVLVYTKGVIRRDSRGKYYLLISAKRSVRSGKK